MFAIKFRKRLTNFKITIALPKKFGSKGFITVVRVIRFEEALVNLISCDMYTLYEVRRGTAPSKKMKLTISKSKSSRLSYILVETVPLVLHRFKSKKMPRYRRTLLYLIGVL